MVHRVMRSKYQKSVTYRNTRRLRLATHLAPFRGERTNDVLFHNAATTYLGKGGRWKENSAGVNLFHLLLHRALCFPQQIDVSLRISFMFAPVLIIQR